MNNEHCAWNNMDPAAFGAIQAEVRHLREELQSLKGDVRSLLELANQSKGGLWMGMGFASVFGAFVSWILTHWPFR